MNHYVLIIFKNDAIMEIWDEADRDAAEQSLANIQQAYSDTSPPTYIWMQQIKVQQPNPININKKHLLHAIS